MAYRRARWVNAKPAAGRAINYAAPVLAGGKLLNLFACNEMGGAPMELQYRNRLSLPAGTPSWGTGTGGVRGMKLPGVNTRQYAIAPGSVLSARWPVSIFWKGVITATPTANNPALIHWNPNGAASYPYFSLCILISSGLAGLVVGCNNGTDPSSFGVESLFTVGVPFTCAATVLPGTDGFRLYFNGRRVGAGLGAASNGTAPLWNGGGNWQYGLGECFALGRGANSVCDYAMVVNKAWNDTEVMNLHNDPYQVFLPTREALPPYVVSIGGVLYTRSLSGALVPLGAVTKLTTKRPVGTITPAAVATKRVTFGARILGSVTAAGSLAKKTRRALSGSLTGASSVIKKTRRKLTASLTPSAAAQAAFTFRQAAAGAITATGALARQFYAYVASAVVNRLTAITRFMGRR